MIIKMKYILDGYPCYNGKKRLLDSMSWHENFFGYVKLKTILNGRNNESDLYWLLERFMSTMTRNQAHQLRHVLLKNPAFSRNAIAKLKTPKNPFRGIRELMDFGEMFPRTILVYLESIDYKL